MGCKVCSVEGFSNGKMCRSCYGKWYKSENKEKIQKQKGIYFKENREHILKSLKEWNKNNPDKVRERSRVRLLDPNQKRDSLVRAKTYSKFKHMRKECQKCGSDGELEFHHTTTPIVFDKFKILCYDCHRGEHGRLIIRGKGNLKRTRNSRDKSLYMKKKWGDLVEQDDSDWKFPKIRYLVEDEIKNGLGVQQAKMKVSKNTGMGFSLVDHRYYMKKNSSSHDKAKGGEQ